jgi:hypothetical protein
MKERAIYFGGRKFKDWKRKIKDWKRKKISSGIAASWNAGNPLDGHYSGEAPIYERLDELDRLWKAGNGSGEIEGNEELGQVCEEAEESFLASDNENLTYSLGEKLNPFLDSLVTVKEERIGNTVREEIIYDGRVIGEAFISLQQRGAIINSYSKRPTHQIQAF